MLQTVDPALTSGTAPLDVPAAARAGREARAIDVNHARRFAANGARPALWLVAAICAISLFHYGTSAHLILLHEILKRLYYVPIVIAAVTYGTTGGLATATFASLLYLPHIVLNGQGGSVFAVERYAELVLFGVVAVVTGRLADRLRAERNRYREAAAELHEAYCQLREGADERLRVDRFVTVGGIASGIAHAIRSPLAGLLGCVEILESEFPRAHPKREFFTIARNQICRLTEVASEFLEFADPAPPSSQVIDLYEVVRSASRLAGPGLGGRAVTIHLHAPPAALFVFADAEQVQRAVLNVILATTVELRNTRVDLAVRHGGDGPAIVIRVPGAEALLSTGDVFDPFPRSGQRHGLALAIARRLVENQRGTLRAERVAGTLEFVIELPPAAQPTEDVAMETPVTAVV